jgi:hypothetical protein
VKRPHPSFSADVIRRERRFLNSYFAPSSPFPLPISSTSPLRKSLHITQKSRPNEFSRYENIRNCWFKSSKTIKEKQEKTKKPHLFDQSFRKNGAARAFRSATSRESRVTIGPEAFKIWEDSGHKEPPAAESWRTPKGSGSGPTAPGGTTMPQVSSWRTGTTAPGGTTPGGSSRRTRVPERSGSGPTTPQGLSWRTPVSDAAAPKTPSNPRGSGTTSQNTTGNTPVSGVAAPQNPSTETTPRRTPQNPSTETTPRRTPQNPSKPRASGRQSDGNGN